MATRTNFEGSNEIGVFSALTNSYCLSGTTKINTGVVLVVVVMKRLWFVRWRLRHNDILRIAAHRADLLFGWCLFCFQSARRRFTPRGRRWQHYSFIS